MERDNRLTPLADACGVRGALTNARRGVVEQTREHARRHGALAEQLRRDAAHALVVRAERRHEQRQRPRIGDRLVQGILRSLEVGRVCKTPQATGLPARPEVAELVPDQITDHGIGARERVEQRRDAGGIRATSARAAQDAEPERENV